MTRIRRRLTIPWRDLRGVLTLGFLIAEITVLLPLLALWLAGE